jgi:hypothetical protein
MSDYVDKDDAEDYFETRLYGTAFEAATDDDQTSALHMATQAINPLPLKGWKYDPSQANAFPRYVPLARGGYYLADVDSSTGDPEVPQAVIDACCEEALELLGNSKRLALQNQHVKGFSIGDLSENYEVPSEIPRLTSATARSFMKPFMAAGVPIV